MPGMVETLTREQCLLRLSGQRVGRVSVSKNALPLIVPVVYTRNGADLEFRAPLDADFAQLCDHAVIAFEIDGLSEIEDSAWSVHVVGVASRLAGSQTEYSASVSLERMSGLQLEATSSTAQAG